MNDWIALGKRIVEEIPSIHGLEIERFKFEDLDPEVIQDSLLRMGKQKVNFKNITDDDGAKLNDIFKDEPEGAEVMQTILAIAQLHPEMIQPLPSLLPYEPYDMTEVEMEGGAVPQNIPLDPALYEEAKEIVYKQYPKHSAYRSGMLVKKYKEMGGTYSGKKTKKGLTVWFKENWKDVGGEPYPVYRPTKRINKDTPLTPEEIDPENLKEQIRLKQKIKGTANLEPFKKKGGKISAPDLQGLLKQSYDSKNPRDYKDYDIDKSLSGQRVQVYKRKGSDEVFVVHRGSQGIQDWGNDLKAMAGYNISDSKRFKHAEKIQKQAENKYGKNNVSTLGHSLSGKIATEVGKDSKDIITLNKFVPPRDYIYNMFFSKPKNETDIRTTLDPVSTLVSGKIFTIPSTTINPLAEHSTDVLGRLDPNTEFGR